MPDRRDESKSQPIGMHYGAFRQAILLQRQGKLREAERLYRAVLKVDQNHFDSLHNLGVIRLVQGYPKAAERQILKALARNRNSAEAHANLAIALLRLDRTTSDHRI